MKRACSWRVAQVLGRVHEGHAMMKQHRQLSSAAVQVTPVDDTGFGAHLLLPPRAGVGVPGDAVANVQVQDALRSALLRHRVVCVPHLRLDQFPGGIASGMKAASHIFGAELEAKGAKGEVVQMYVVQDRSPSLRGSDFWHSDLSYLHQPSHVTLLWAAEVPPNHGDTLFCDMKRAWAELDDAKKQLLAPLTAIHCQKLHLDEARARGRSVPEAKHPVVRCHPVSGEPCLFLNPGYVHRLNGIDGAAGEALLEDVYKHCLQERFLLRHRWKPAELLLWDNATVMHKATTLDMPAGARRVMFRTSVIA